MMKNKIVGIFVCTLLVLIFMPITVSQDEIVGEDNVKISNVSIGGIALFAYIYMELYPADTAQVDEILENYNRVPKDKLTNIDIIATDPNQHLNRDLCILPFIRWLFFNTTEILPDETVKIHITSFSGGVNLYVENNMLIIDGWAILISWKSL